MQFKVSLLYLFRWSFICLGVLPALVSAQSGTSYSESDSIEKQLAKAGDNRAELEAALRSATGQQLEALEFLIEHMPPHDLNSLSGEFLIEHVQLACEARKKSPWKIPDALFLNDVLPYANVDETRERWRPHLQELSQRLCKDCQSPAEAAQRLNEKLFGEVKVKYSTQREKPNQSPSESIRQGLASCTGLSILLVDACRSVNVPARLVGIPNWSNKNGNHTWVEIWSDGKWHFTGAAEPSSQGLNHAWFQGDAALAQKDKPEHSIYATSYKPTGLHFPMVWATDDQSVPAANVTDHYTKSAEAADGTTRVMISARLTNRTRTTISVRVVPVEDAAADQAGTTRDESADTNDFLTFELDRNREYELQSEALSAPVRFSTADIPQLMLDLHLPESRQAHQAAWSKVSAANCEAMLAAHAEKIRQERQDEWDARRIELDDLSMKYEYRVFGDQPSNGHSLFISMHGGGGAPAEVNEKQWKNQIELYEPKEGIYVAPRAPTDTWNLWHQPHIDLFFARLIENFIVFEGIDANRVYLTGYSAGGDGVYQLAPRMADQLAAAAMMAGHPNDASPLGLRNIGFALHMGAEDSAFDRNEVAKEWGRKLADLQRQDPDGYHHDVVIHPGLGHWMKHQDATAIEWMANCTRDPLPNKIVWHQSNVTHDRFYWLAVDQANRTPKSTIYVRHEGNRFTIGAFKKLSRVKIRLNQSLIDPAQPIVVEQPNQIMIFDNVLPDLELLEHTIRSRGDKDAVFLAEIDVPLGSIPQL